MHLNCKNELIKREYIKWLTHATKKDEKTINSIMTAIYQFDDFTNHAPYQSFNRKKALDFKNYLLTRKGKKGPLANSTIRQRLKNLRAFFQWLCSQPGYKSKINTTELEYLSPDSSISQYIDGYNPKKVPTFEYITALVDSIKGSDNISMRDRALIALLSLTGIRIDAAASLPLGAVDLAKSMIMQDPKIGVRTKFGKIITSYIFPFDNKLLNVFEEWVYYLKNEEHFSDTDPLFPATLVDQRQDGYAFMGNGTSRRFWSSAGPIRRILLERSKVANLEYFTAHSFRHFTIQYAMKYCRTPEELKAISQSLGHKTAMITLTSYGTLDTFRIEEVIRGIDFVGTKSYEALAIKTVESVIRALDLSKSTS